MTYQSTIFDAIKARKTEVFFNTIHLQGSELSVARGKCNRQENRILDLMTPGVKYTPFELQRLYETKWPPVPVTSIRARMTTLTDKGLLIKHGVMVMERFGKSNHLWSKK